MKISADAPVERIHKNGTQKMQLLFVDKNARNNSFDLSKEIELNSSTPEDAQNKISKKQLAIDAVVASANLDFFQIKNLRETTEQRNLPLIIYTSEFDQKTKDMALKLEADDYFYGSLAYTFASRVKFVKRLKAFKVQWLKREHEHSNNRDETSKMLHFLERRVADVILSLIGLILLSPIILLIAAAREIEFIYAHVFSKSKNEDLASRIFKWYEFLVLVLYSPIFLIITAPLKIGSKEEYIFSKSKMVGPGHRVFDQYKFKTELDRTSYTQKTRTTLLGKFLIKTGLVNLPQLVNVLKGDISLFDEKPISVTGRLELMK